MSEIPAAHKQPSDPNKKEPDDEKKRIEIPAWWSIVALIMVGLVVLPIHYANLHAKKDVTPTEAEAKLNAPEAASPAKQDVAPAQTPVARTTEQAEAQPKPATVEATPPAKEAVAPAETPVTRTTEQAEAQPKPATVEATPPAKEAVVPAETPVTRTAEPAAQPKPATVEATPPAKEDVAPAEAPVAQTAAPAEAQPKPGNAEAAAPAKQEAAAAETPAKEAVAPEAQAKPRVAEAASQTKQIGQPASEIKQPVALPKNTAEKLKVENAAVFRIEGKDKQDRAAAFDFIILSSDYTWALGSTSQIVSGGKVIPGAEAPNRIFAPKVRDALAGESDLIGVGLASKDGKRSEEEARALARSKTVATWITKVAKPETALWALTLGQYDKGCKLQEDKDSSFERPVLFVGVRSKAEGANLQEALADALNGHDNLPSRECYSRFDLEKIR